jgi:nucleotide-binding universal stress UspA family protein
MSPTGPVLVGYDDTPESDAAASLAAELAESLGAPLELCHVSAPTASPEHRDRDRAWTENMHRIAQRMLDDGVSRIPTAVVTTTILEGSPGCELARRAVARAATCVVMGSRGYGPARAVLLGSVTRELLDRAGTPVVVAPRLQSAHASIVTAAGRV